MRKNDKRKYLSPETEIVRFNVDDIITTSGVTGPGHNGEIVGGGSAQNYDPDNIDIYN